MFKSINYLLSNSIDYAALKPPVEAPIRKAFENYAALTHDENSWILSRFVIPYSQISDMVRFSDRYDSVKGPLNLCIFGPIVDSLHDFKTSVLNIEKDILYAHSGFPGEVKTNVLELTLPTLSVENFNDDELVKAIEVVVRTSADSKILPDRVFFEIPGNTYDINLAKKILKVIAVHNKSVYKRKIENYLFSGFKINCTPDPTSKFLAELIQSARDANVAIKFAGHNVNSFTYFDDDINMKIHGFINIMLAGLLSYSQALTIDEAIEVLDEKNPLNFTFKDNYIAWKEYATPATEIKMLRMLSYISFNLTHFNLPRVDFKKHSIL